MFSFQINSRIIKMSEEGDIPDQESKIGTFYAGKSVFITGATGFMGKVRRLKLFLRLRAC